MKTALIIISSLCTLTVCTGCNKQDPFENGENPFLYNGEASTSGVTRATTLTVRTDEEDLIGGTSFDRTITIRFNEGGQATVSGDANNIVKVNGNRVTADNTATSEKVKYELSGSTSNGFFKLYSNNKQAIVLNDVSITNPNGAAINNQGKKRSFVVVNGNNSLADGNAYTLTPDGEDEKGAFFSEGQLIFSGDGNLTVSAKGKAGITSDDYLHFMASPTVKVTSSAGHAVRGKDAVIVSDGVLEAIATKAMKKGVASDSLVLFDGGVTTISVSGGSGLVVSGASEPAVLSGVTPSGGSSVFNGMGILGGSASGGTAVSLSTYSSGSGMGGPGGGRGW